MWTNDITQIIFINWGIMLAFCAVLWAFCMAFSDVSIIDRFWGPMCAAPSVMTLLQTDTYSPHALAITALAVIWALRLSYHITTKNWNAGQDFRYDEDESPALTRASSPLKTLGLVFFGQATLAWLVSFPVQLGQFYTAGMALSYLAWIGIAVCVIGFFIEMIGDLQLLRFKCKPENKGKIMDQGLWAWTRHPNYFGDATVWFGLGIIALEAPLGLYGMFGPILLCYFLVKQTGVDLTEKVMLKKYPIYQEYMDRTSKFIPLPPRRQD